MTWVNYFKYHPIFPSYKFQLAKKINNFGVKMTQDIVDKRLGTRYWAQMNHSPFCFHIPSLNASEHPLRNSLHIKMEGKFYFTYFNESEFIFREFKENYQDWCKFAGVLVLSTSCSHTQAEG